VKQNRLLTTIIATLLFLSCSREYSFEGGLSDGSLKADAGGLCLPSSVAGIYKKDSLLNATHYINLQANISTPGTYIIQSDTVNGYSFFGVGIFSNAGLNEARVYARGRPVNPGVNTFTMKYNSTKCLMDVSVVPPATYIPGGSGGDCTGVLLSGIYKAEAPMTASNTVVMDVDVITAGAYSISTAANGVTFSSTGTFTHTGVQQVVLTASGTPLAGGPITYTLNGTSGNCTFIVSYLAARQAEFTFLNFVQPNYLVDCLETTVQGAYLAGVPLTAANTVTLKVFVTVPGAYSITTLTNNGYTFSKSGIFSIAGNQTVVLQGSGTPTIPGINTFSSFSAGACNFYVTVL
jgi:hypothetical protein